MEKITVTDLAIQMRISKSTVRRIKAELGYKAGNRLDTDMVPEFKAMHKKMSMVQKTINKDHNQSYIEALEIIKKDGYIDLTVLNVTFGNNYSGPALAYFESMNDPLYQETLYYGVYHHSHGQLVRRHKEVFYRWNAVVDQWREENKGFSQSENYGRHIKVQI